MVGIPADGLLEHPNVLIGSVDAIVEPLQERRERYGVNYVSVQQTELEAFAPVVARLAGPVVPSAGDEAAVDRDAPPR